MNVAMRGLLPVNNIRLYPAVYQNLAVRYPIIGLILLNYEAAGRVPKPKSTPAAFELRMVSILMEMLNRT